MTYPGTKEKGFYELMCLQAAQGNPAAMAFVAKREGIILDNGKPVKKYVCKYLPPIDPVIEAQMEAEQAETEKAEEVKLRQWAGGQKIPLMQGDNVKTCKLTDAEKFDKLDKAREFYGKTQTQF